MFAKILIANRGEIACRVIRTARRMGIKTVAVYSEADADALHRRQADEAVAIGPPPAAESYLRIDRILEACRSTGAEAVHPGYGFLSEKAEFAEALAAAGIAFIGPDARAIAAMGDKIESKKLAKEAGVSTVPGHLEVIPSADAAVKIARAVGYPVMIKASAGGGGKGMRIARNDAETREGFRSASNEARSSFADDRVFIEKYVEEPRHIEIQVLGDAHGQVIYLGERECSIQRRHQKVIEEAPSPFLDAKTRAAMGEEAVALAKAVGYRSAGTVEFIVDKDRNFYFLEMNTRLQVEHPVTELVAGLDLVECMIRIAAGEKLSVKQSDIKLTGSAIEARIYAEDPLRNFLPSIGRLVRYLPPAGEGVRVDTGVFEGAEISLYYDPMIAKLVAYGASRNEAIARLGAALDAFYIRGLSHNVAFLAAVLQKPRFAEGRLSTGFIAEEFPHGFAGVEPSPDALDLALAAAAAIQRIIAEQEARITGQLAGHGRVVPEDWIVAIGAAQHAVRAMREANSVAVTRADGRRHVVATDWQPAQPLFRARIDGAAVIFQFDRDGIGFRLTRAGTVLGVKVLPPRAAELLAQMPVKQLPDLSRYLLSPMPGLLVSVAVGEGQEVKAGEELAVVEAMKMENVLRAERDGTVAKVRARAGDSLAVDQVILEFA
ncbi:MAG TPA: acetyl/propionyl/methylcrotonyl-CoA carboxylase subunit alpha [Stellaceae bacterium]|nr:acetyl/propionyl/methylcrotonyl-CoA carboxylase subunit alpha [Stellaceae bacterium]